MPTFWDAVIFYFYKIFIHSFDYCIIFLVLLFFCIKKRYLDKKNILFLIAISLVSIFKFIPSTISYIATDWIETKYLLSTGSLSLNWAITMYTIFFYPRDCVYSGLSYPIFTTLGHSSSIPPPSFPPFPLFSSWVLAPNPLAPFSWF